MSKRVIIIDGTDKCPSRGIWDYIKGEEVYACYGNPPYHYICPEKEFPDWCPLTEMPKRWTPATEDYSRCVDSDYFIGWNECLDEIEGGGKDG